MSLEVKTLENNDSKHMTLWLNKTMGTLLHQEDELAKAIQKKIARKSMTESKAAKNSTPKKACICAPTNHTGSFRCHLHQNNNGVARNSSWSVEDGSGKLQSKANFNAKNGHLDVVEKQPRLSRFGRAASVRTCHDNLPFARAEQVN